MINTLVGILSSHDSDADDRIRDEAKKTQARDQSFAAQLNNVADILKRIDKKTNKRSQRHASSPPECDLQTLDPETSELLSELQNDNGLPGNYKVSDPRKSVALQMLAEAGNSVSLTGVADEIRSALGLSRVALHPLRTEIINTIWDSSWRADDSISDVPAGQPSAEVYFRNLAQNSGAGYLDFDGSRAREAAVADTISRTYSWIYNRHPDPENSGGIIWSSFPEWLERPSDSTYWITGKPGSGKSTIMKHILVSSALKVHLREWAGDIPLFVVSYYAWNAGATLQKSFRGLKMTLLSQLLQQQPMLLPLLFPRRVAFLKLVGLDTQLWKHEDKEIDEAFNTLLGLSADRSRICLAIFIDGLDEFNAAPTDVVALIESITTSSRNGVKVCVASRPWVEYDDAYRDVPKLQMDLHTRADMTTFVTEKFRRCKAFSDLKKAYPDRTTQLLLDMTVKANGVFIWLRVVVKSLVESATEGTGMRGLEDILESLPSDIELLYDAIWERIPPHSQKRGAVLLWLMDISPINVGLRWVLAWLADEYAFRTYDIARENLGTGQSFQHIQVSLKRKLASRTRGLLELERMVQQSADKSKPEGVGTWKVGFTHRTVKDWASQQSIREKIVTHCGDSFNPYLFLLQMYAIQLTSAELCPRELDLLWLRMIKPALVCAEKVSCDSTQMAQSLVETLRAFDKAASQLLRGWNLPVFQGSGHLHHWSGVYTPRSLSTYTPLEPTDDGRAKSFMNLAAQFAILEYIKAEAATNPHILNQPGTRDSLGILECAIFGPILYRGCPDVYQGGNYGILIDVDVLETRLATIRFLLDNGVKQADMFISPTHTPGVAELSSADFGELRDGKTLAIQRILALSSRRAKNSNPPPVHWEAVGKYADYLDRVAGLLNASGISLGAGVKFGVSIHVKTSFVRSKMSSVARWLKSRGDRDGRKRARRIA